MEDKPRELVITQPTNSYIANTTTTQQIMYTPLQQESIYLPTNTNVQAVENRILMVQNSDSRLNFPSGELETNTIMMNQMGFFSSYQHHHQAIMNEGNDEFEYLNSPQAFQFQMQNQQMVRDGRNKDPGQLSHNGMTGNQDKFEGNKQDADHYFSSEMMGLHTYPTLPMGHHPLALQYATTSDPNLGVSSTPNSTTPATPFSVPIPNHFLNNQNFQLGTSLNQSDFIDNNQIHSFRGNISHSGGGRGQPVKFISKPIMEQSKRGRPRLTPAQKLSRGTSKKKDISKKLSYNQMAVSNVGSILGSSSLLITTTKPDNFPPLEAESIQESRSISKFYQNRTGDDMTNETVPSPLPIRKKPKRSRNLSERKLLPLPPITTSNPNLEIAQLNPETDISSLTELRPLNPLPSGSNNDLRQDLAHQLATKSNYQLLKEGRSKDLGLDFGPQASIQLERRKQAHKDAERLRRLALNDQYTQLRSIVPGLVEKDSKLSVLTQSKYAIDNNKKILEKQNQQITKMLNQFGDGLGKDFKIPKLDTLEEVLRFIELLDNI